MNTRLSPEATSFTFTDPDGYEIFVRKWMPARAPKSVVQIAHGASEHGLRYERLARFLNESGYSVYANDHRGHGETAGTLEVAGEAGPGGWNALLEDAWQLTEIIRQENPGLPVFLFGHSMGSLMAQGYIERWGRMLQGAVLSGTFGAMPQLDELIAMVEAEPQDQPSAGFVAMFAGFNAPFPLKTGFEWLSRDEDEVQKYVDDPWCGFPFKSSLVAEMLRGARETWRPENEACVPKELPIFLVSGEQDPAGGNTVTVQMLIARYQALGIRDVTWKFYPEARHELLNETCREEVQSDLLAWLDGHV
jgi:alpha-beta hydrolase superfamily lysophospholipase